MQGLKNCCTFAVENKQKQNNMKYYNDWSKKSFFDFIDMNEYKKEYCDMMEERSNRIFNHLVK